MVSPEVFKWWSSYLRGRPQSVISGDFSSSWWDLKTGVPQGSILFPLLFSISIDLITPYASVCIIFMFQCAYHLYTEDLQQPYCQTSVDHLYDAIDKLNRDSVVKNWSDHFEVAMVVSPTQCKAIVIESPESSMRNLNGYHRLFMTAVIPFSSDVKDLVLHVDTCLDWCKQAATASQRVIGTLRLLCR